MWKKKTRKSFSTKQTQHLKMVAIRVTYPVISRILSRTMDGGVSLFLLRNLPLERWAFSLLIPTDLSTLLSHSKVPQHILCQTYRCYLNVLLFPISGHWFKFTSLCLDYPFFSSSLWDLVKALFFNSVITCILSPQTLIARKFLTD